MSKKYRDEIAMVCHDTMKDMQAVGGVTEDDMREFEKNCLVSVPEPSSESGSPLSHGADTPVLASPHK
jgi:hypothetical protein